VAKRVCVLWADPESGNLGVQALARGVEAIVRSIDSDADIEFQSYGSGPAPLEFRRSVLLKEMARPGAVSAWLKNFDVVIDMGDGDSYASSYGADRLSLMTLAKMLVKRTGTPLILGPQTIGPFGSPSSKALGALGLSCAHRIFVRDSVSLTRLPKWYASRARLSTDVCFALPQPGEVDRHHEPSVLVNVSGLLWNENSFVDHKGYRRSVATFVRLLKAAGDHVAGLVHVASTQYPDSDDAVAHAAMESLGLPVLHRPVDLEDARRIIAEHRLVVASRMHAVLNSLSVGTPAISLAYSPKARPLLADLGWTLNFDLAEGQIPESLAAALLRGVDDADVEAVREFALERLRVFRHGLVDAWGATT